MRIAVDYDNTYSSDPAYFDWVMRAAAEYGHEARIVTYRDDRFDRTAALIEVEAKWPVIYTRGVAKGWYCTHFGDGFIPDVWIDDRPISVLENSAGSPESLAEWRGARPDGAHVEDKAK